MSHLWKIDLYKVLMFPGCFREDLVAGGRHSSWGTKPFRRILSKTCLSFKKLKDSEKKKTKVNQKQKKQNPTLQILPTLPQPARYVCTRQRPAAVPSSPGTSPPFFPPGRRRAAEGHRWGGRRERRRTRSPGAFGGLEIGILEAFWRSRFPIFVRNFLFFVQKMVVLLILSGATRSIGGFKWQRC